MDNNEFDLQKEYISFYNKTTIMKIIFNANTSIMFSFIIWYFANKYYQISYSAVVIMYIFSYTFRSISNQFSKYMFSEENKKLDSLQKTIESKLDKNDE